MDERVERTGICCRHRRDPEWRRTNVSIVLQSKRLSLPYIVRDEIQGSLVSETSISWEGIRSIAHALHSTSNRDIFISSHDPLRSKHDCLHARSADLVYSRSFRLVPQTSLDGRLTCRRLPYSRLEDVSHVDILDRLGLDTCLCDCGFDGCCTEIRCSELLQGAVEGANGGPLLWKSGNCSRISTIAAWTVRSVRKTHSTNDDYLPEARGGR